MRVLCTNPEEPAFTFSKSSHKCTVSCYCLRFNLGRTVEISLVSRCLYDITCSRRFSSPLKTCGSFRLNFHSNSHYPIRGCFGLTRIWRPVTIHRRSCDIVYSSVTYSIFTARRYCSVICSACCYDRHYTSVYTVVAIIQFEL